VAQPTAVRAGTATRRGGQATATRILDVACEVLAARGREGFSMRSVAEAAGLHLANVQYYFPKRDDLVTALLQHIGERYKNAYDELLADASDDARERFSIILEYNLADTSKRETRQFFIQLWALLDSLDGHSGVLLDELYKTDIAQLSEAIALMHPEVAATEITARTTLLAAMIEGMMVVRGPTKELKDKAFATAMQIADGRH
jgi:AcrR family transcriptional regulator